MAQQFNDEQCRLADDPAHRCTDKHGHWFASPVRPARPGSMCWWETLRRLEDERSKERAALRRLAEASTLDDIDWRPAPSHEELSREDWLDSFDDQIDTLESEEVR